MRSLQAIRTAVRKPVVGYVIFPALPEARCGARPQPRGAATERVRRSPAAPLAYRKRGGCQDLTKALFAMINALAHSTQSTGCAFAVLTALPAYWDRPSTGMNIPPNPDAPQSYTHRLSPPAHHPALPSSQRSNASSVLRAPPPTSQGVSLSSALAGSPATAPHRTRITLDKWDTPDAASRVAAASSVACAVVPALRKALELSGNKRVSPLSRPRPPAGSRPPAKRVGRAPAAALAPRGPVSRERELRRDATHWGVVMHTAAPAPSPSPSSLRLRIRETDASTRSNTRFVPYREL
ncbi:hypothetical protein B0H17DRAFT_1192336 [Mycena rosella]|uniref:Uncharacterized protein n=1 Tax=Mycena rosella TaxID=1033263 RepID=A0AAD7GWJ4_MYCRO|nr:hypothetical protein B0H17DRAFT_1192336 [Mycena rosella]